MSSTGGIGGFKTPPPVAGRVPNNNSNVNSVTIGGISIPLDASKLNASTVNGLQKLNFSEEKKPATPSGREGVPSRETTAALRAYLSPNIKGR